MAFPSPSLTPPSLSTWQFWYNSYVIGAGEPVGQLRVTGLGDLPDIGAKDEARSRDFGELIGLDLYRGRTVTMNLWAKSDGTSLQDTLLNLAAATVCGLQTEQPMWFQLPNYPLLCWMCRPRKRTTPWDVQYASANVAVPVAEFHGTDPRIYAAGQTASIGLNGPVPGMTFPATFPLTFGSATPDSLVVANAGNVEMRPILVITGPCTNPTVQNASISGTPALTFTNPLQSSYTVLAGDQLVIDLDLQSILYYVGGVGSGSAPASRAGWLVPGSTWWDLPPGNNTIQFFSSDSAAVAGTLAVQWASAYML